MSEQLELLMKNFPVILLYRKRSLLDDEQDDKRRKLARQLQSLVEEVYPRIDIDNVHGKPFDVRELKEVKTRRMIIDCPQGIIHVRAAWIDETGIAVIGLAYQVASGTVLKPNDNLVDQYKTLVEKWFISDNRDPLIVYDFIN